MDIYDFLNSRDVAEHCRKIGKTWTPFEMAAIIDRSGRTTAEKHAGWRAIIAEYADMPTPVNGSGRSYESLHKKLSEYIDYEEQLFESFKKPEKGVLYVYSDWSGCCDDHRCAFDNFETALSHAAKYYRGHVLKMIRSFIYDNAPANDYFHMTALFNNDNNLNLVRIEGISSKLPNLGDIFNNGVLFDPFAEIQIPLPFERGDILASYKGLWGKKDYDTVFVFDSFERNVITLPKAISGVIVGENGDLHDYSSSYRLEEFEYYRGELKDSRRLLHYVSLFMKGKIRLPELLAIQSKIKWSFQLDDWILRESSRDLPEVIRGDYYQEDKAVEAAVVEGRVLSQDREFYGFSLPTAFD